MSSCGRVHFAKRTQQLLCFLCRETRDFLSTTNFRSGREKEKQGSAEQNPDRRDQRDRCFVERPFAELKIISDATRPSVVLGCG